MIHLFSWKSGVTTFIPTMPDIFFCCRLRDGFQRSLHEILQALSLVLSQRKSRKLSLQKHIIHPNALNMVRSLSPGIAFSFTYTSAKTFFSAPVFPHYFPVSHNLLPIKLCMLRFLSGNNNRIQYAPVPKAPRHFKCPAKCLWQLPQTIPLRFLFPVSLLLVSWPRKSDSK